MLSAYDPVAHSEATEVERRSFTPRTVTGDEEFEEVLDLIRAQGWAADVEETWEGVAAVAAPIHDRRRMPVGAVAVTGAVERVCADGRAAARARRGRTGLRPRRLPGSGRRALLSDPPRRR